MTDIDGSSPLASPIACGDEEELARVIEDAWCRWPFVSVPQTAAVYIARAVLTHIRARSAASEIDSEEASTK